MIPTKPHRAKALEAVLGSRGVRESINGYKDNDVLYRLKDTKHTHFGTYKPAMAPQSSQWLEELHIPINTKMIESKTCNRTEYLIRNVA